MSRAIAKFEAGFAHLYASSDADLEYSATSGLPWSLAVELAQSLCVSEATLANWLDVDVSELRDGAATARAMAPPQGYLLLFIARLVGRVDVTMKSACESSGTTPGGWLGEWLQRPSDDVQGRMPAEFLCTPSRRDHLADLLGRLEPVERGSDAEERGNALLAQAAMDGLSDVAAGSVVGFDDGVAGIALPAIPLDFPGAGEGGGAVPGAQPKLLCRRIDGRYLVGPTDDEVAERHAACCDLVTALVEYTERKQRELPSMDRSTLLRKVREGVVAKGLDFSSTELDWVMGRVGAAHIAAR